MITRYWSHLPILSITAHEPNRLRTIAVPAFLSLCMLFGLNVSALAKTATATVPGAPTGVNVTKLGDKTVTVAFVAPTSDGGSAITSYTAIARIVGGNGTVVSTATVTSSPVTVASLTNGVNYNFTVKATNSVGSGPESSPARTGIPSGPTGTVPGVPTGVNVIALGDTTVTVAFVAPASDGGSAITSYTASARIVGGSGSVVSTAKVASSPVIVTNLTNGTNYNFTILATNAVGSGPESSPARTGIPRTVPGAPTIGTATGGNGQATVSYTAPASNGGDAISSYTATSAPGNLTGSVSQAGSGSITVTGLTNGTAYTFKVKATNGAGTGAESAASNSVTATAPNSAPVITTQPQNTGALADQAATFTVVASGTAPLSYQWSKNGVTISGATSASYTTTAAVVGDNGAKYQVLVTNPGGSTTSSIAILTVNYITIVSRPTGDGAPVGGTVTYQVVAVGNPATLSYQWCRRAPGGTTYDPISGATGSSYTTPPVVIGDNGARYMAWVSNTFVTKDSDNAILIVDTLPVIRTQPASQTVNLGQPVTFSTVAAASGTSPISYQWSKNGTSVGTNSASYNIPATTAADNSASISVVVSNFVGSANSSKATLTVTSAPGISVSVAPSSATLNTSATQTFNATVTGSSNTSVNWTCTGGTITTAGLYTAPASTGTYLVRATSQADSTKFAEATVTVTSAPVVSISVAPSSVTLNVSATQTFNATVTGSSNTSVTWTCTSGTITTGGLYTAPTNAGTCRVRATSQADTTKYAEAAVTVTSTVVILGPLAAFPGCEGMGCGATGGRNGDVYTVNTLSDTVNSGCVPQNGPNGPTCSLRDAMTKTGKRTIVFSVSGTITIMSTVWDVPADLTIAGQTAPNGGIQVKGPGPGYPEMGNNHSMLWLNGGNTIVRYMRLRPGDADANTANQGLVTMTIEGTNDTVLDHNSFEWDCSKAVSWLSADREFQRNTFSWNLDGESLAQINYPHSTGIILGSTTQAYIDRSSWDGHHNVFATISHRLPYANVKYGRFINNLMFGYDFASLVTGGTQFDLIGNVYDGGMSSNFKAWDDHNEVRWADTVAHYEGQPISGGKAQIYMRNNFGPNNPSGTLNNFSTMLRIASTQNGQLNDVPVDTQYMATSQTIPSSLNNWPINVSTLSNYSNLKGLLTPTVGAYQKLDSKGAWIPNRDALDARIINYIMNPSSSPSGCLTTAGTYPDLSGSEKRIDSDGDGMPDIWEDAHGLNKFNASDRNIIRSNANGYTNLELYLSGLFPNGNPLP